MNVDNMIPIFWMLGSVTSCVTMQALIKVLSEEISTQYIIALRAAILIMFNSILITKSKQYEPYELVHTAQQKIQYFRLNIKDGKYLKLMVKRIVCSVVATNCFLSCLKYLHISVANALLNTTPVLTFFVEAYYYKKSVNRVNLCISLVSFVGVTLILNPVSHMSTEKFNWYLLLPLIAALANSLNWIFLHDLRSKFKEIVVLEYNYYFQFIISNIVMLGLGTMNTSDDSKDLAVFRDYNFYIKMLVIAILAYITSFLRIKAMFKKKPSQVLAFNFIQMIYSIFIDTFFFHTHMEFLTVLGALLTSSGLLIKVFVELFDKESTSQNAK